MPDCCRNVLHMWGGALQGQYGDMIIRVYEYRTQEHRKVSESCARLVQDLKMLKRAV